LGDCGAHKGQMENGEEKKNEEKDD